MFEVSINKASQLEEKIINIASGIQDSDQKHHQTQTQIETLNSINEILREINALKENCHDEYKRKISETLTEKDKLKLSLNTLQLKYDELEIKYKRCIEEHEEFKRTKESVSKNSQKDIKELEEKIKILMKKEYDTQEQKIKINILENCKVLEEKHTLFMESLNTINIHDLLTDLKSSLSLEDNEKYFLNVLEAKSKEIIATVSSNEQLNENDKSLKSQNIQKYFNELETILKENLNRGIIETVERKTKDSFEKSLNLFADLKEFLSQNLSTIKQNLDDIFKESRLLNDTNISLNEMLSNEKRKYQNERINSEGLTNINLKLNEELKRKDELIHENLLSMNNTEEIISRLEEEKKSLNLSYDKLKINYQSSEKLCRDLSEKMKNLEVKFNKTSISLEETSSKFETCINTIRKILSHYLEDEYFIDLINNCFKNKEINTEEILKTSKIIKTCINVKSYKYIFNEILKPKLFKHNGLENFFNEIASITYEFKSIDQFYCFNSKIDQDENNLLNKFISEILENLDTQIKENSELKENLKKSKEKLEKSIMNEIESKETLSNENITLKNSINEYSKLEKSLKDTIQSLQINLQTLQHSHDNINKDFLILKENHDLLGNKKLQVETENCQLTKKLEENSSEIKSEKAKNESLLLEKKELLNKISDLEKVRVTLNEKNENLIQKENENITLKNSIESLKTNYQNLKNDNEKQLENLNQKLKELTNKKSENEVTIKTLEETNNQLSQNVNVNGLNDRIANLEAENSKLKQQKLEIKKHAEEVRSKMKNDLKDSEYLIDKRILSNFLFKLFDKSNTEKLRMSVLETLSNFLNFNNEERKKIGLSPSTTIHYNNCQTDKLKDISDDLYNFILNA